jgi:uncharacterized RDD family membrane protein YckC
MPPVEPGAVPPVTTAGLGVRIGARLLDGLLVGLPASIILGLLGVGTVGFGLRGWTSSVVMALLWFGYFVWFESNRGATVGKQLLKIRVVTADGRPPPVDVAAKRNVWMLLGIVPVVGGLLSLVAVIAIMVTIASNPDNRGLHDTFAGSGVVR